MKHFAWILLLALVPIAETQAQVRIGGGVSIRFGDGKTRIVPHVHIDIGGGRHARRHTPPEPRCDAPRGHYKIVTERVWVPPIYRYRHDHCGRRIRYCVRRGYWKSIERRVWVPAPRVVHRVPARGHTRGHDRGRGHDRSRSHRRR